MTANINTQNKEGVDVSQTYTVSTSTPEYPAAPFAVGEHVLGSNGTEWVFVKAGAAIAQYAAVQIDAAFNVVPLTTALAAALWDVGFAQVAIASGDYGWVCIRGENISILTKGAVTKQAALYTSTSAGILVNNTTSGTKITGVMISTSYASTSTLGRSAVASWPRASV
jgi:hypothetical protein